MTYSQRKKKVPIYFYFRGIKSRFKMTGKHNTAEKPTAMSDDMYDYSPWIFSFVWKMLTELKGLSQFVSLWCLPCAYLKCIAEQGLEKPWNLHVNTHQTELNSLRKKPDTADLMRGMLSRVQHSSGPLCDGSCSSQDSLYNLQRHMSM